MTVIQLHSILAELIQKGKGLAPVLFDTEAKSYDYHMAPVDRAFFEEEPYPHLALHENKHNAPDWKSRAAAEKRISDQLCASAPVPKRHDPCYLVDQNDPDEADIDSLETEPGGPDDYPSD